MRILKLFLLGSSVALSAAGAFAQGTGEWGTFTLHNNSDYTINGFYTNEGDGWSDNWLSGTIGSGTAADLEFNNKDGYCEVSFKVSWAGTANDVVEDWKADFCQITNLYMTNDGAAFD